MSMEFFNLCANNKLAEAQALWEAGRIDVLFTDQGRRTALAFSAGRGHLGVVNWLLGLGSPLEVKDVDGRTALARAAINGHKAVMEVLLDAGADINSQNNDGCTVLSDVISKGKADKEASASFLIERGAALDILDKFKRTALHYAARDGTPNLVKMLTEKGAQVNGVDMYKQTALMYAQNSNNSAIVAILTEAEENAVPVQEGAAADLPEQAASDLPKKAAPDIPEQEIPNLRLAVKKGNEEMVRYYLDQGEDVNQMFYDLNNNKRESLFTMAVSNRNENIVKMLIEAGVDVNERFYRLDGFRQEALETLEKHGFDTKSSEHRAEVIFEKLTEAYRTEGLDLNDRLRDKTGAFETDYMMQAIIMRTTPIIKMLLEAGFDLFALAAEPTSNYGGSYYLDRLLNVYFFDHSYSAELAELQRLFMQAGPPLDLESFKSILTYPSSGAPSSFFTEIVNHSGDINEQGNDGKTILHYALNWFRDKFFHEGQGAPPKTSLGDLWIDAILDHDDIDVNIYDYGDNPPLYYACSYATGRIVRKLLTMGADMNALCGSESTPLALLACQAKKEDVLEAFCAFGADVNVADSHGVSLLHTACQEQDHKLVRFLLDKGADPMSTDNKGDTPLHTLVKKASAGIVKIIDLLLEKGALINAVNHQLQTPFFAAFTASDQLIVPLLNHMIKCGASVDAQDKNENTCLHHAVKNDKPQGVKFLLENGADSNVRNSEGQSPYQLALDKNRRAIVSMIEKATASLDMDGDDLDAAFMRACKYGRRGVAEMLVRSGNIDVTYVDEFGRTPLHYIAQLGAIALAKFTIDQGVDLNYTDNFGQTALHFAAGNLQKEVFRLLVEHGADPKIPDDNGVLPIHLITNRGQHDLLGLLLDLGESANSMTNAGQSLLHTACYTRSRECVRVLLEHGVDPNILDESGLSALIVCVNINQKEIVKMLLAAGANINSKDLDGDESIHIAAMRGFKDMLQLLLENGAMVDSLNNRGLAPLHLAAYFGYKDIFKFLIDRGADFDIKTGAGKSCIDIAAENGQKELIELIAIIQKRRKMAAGE